MTDLQIRGTPEALGYLAEIATEMTQLFQITTDEAYGRINDQLGGRAFVTPLEVNNLKHEEQDVWAKHIYYGRQSFWWLGEDELRPLPYTPTDSD